MHSWCYIYKLIHRPEEELDLKSECILVSAMVHLPQEWNFGFHKQVWKSGAKWENNKQSLCLLAHFQFICCMQFIKGRIFIASHTQIRISTTSHVRICIRYCKSCVLHLNVQWNPRFYDKIIITVPRLLPLALLIVLRTRNNTDDNELVIFSNIASYCGDNYIL